MSTELQKKSTVSLSIEDNYHVVIHNDDKTTFDCVIFVLQDVFRFSIGDGFMTAQAVHKLGSAIVGSYSRDIAETKVSQAMSLAEEMGYPLLFTVEQA